MHLNHNRNHARQQGYIILSITQIGMQMQNVKRYRITKMKLSYTYIYTRYTTNLLCMYLNCEKSAIGGKDCESG